MPPYLSQSEAAEAAQILELLYSLPYIEDMPGKIWEQIFAGIKGGEWKRKRGNRPDADVVVGAEKYSLKTEALRRSRKRSTAASFRGHVEDLVVARPPITAEYLSKDETLAGLSPDDLGRRVLTAYNALATKYWTKIGVLLRLAPDKRVREFLYWHQDVEPYPLDGHSWTDTGKAKGQSRNIKVIDDPKLPALFKWTSGGSQFYVRYRIPEDVEIIRIEPVPMTVAELRNHLRRGRTSMRVARVLRSLADLLDR